MIRVLCKDKLRYRAVVKMNIAVFNAQEWEIPKLKKRLKGHKVSFYNESLTEENAKKAEKAEVVSAFISSKITKKVIARLPKLKMVTTRSTGFDHIDLKECRKRKIAVCNVPAYCDVSVAEHAFALVLAVGRKVVESADKTRMGNFDLHGLRGVELEGKTIGILGTGKIGKHAIKIAKGFGMDVIAYDKFPDKKAAAEMGFVYVGLKKLLQASDVVSVHLPLTEETRHMISIKNIDVIKKGAIIVNTSRGAIIETKALIKGIKSGRILGVGLDVLEEECEMDEEAELLVDHFRQKCNLQTLLEQHILAKMPNVVITPHNAFNTEEAVSRLISSTADNIIAFAKGKPVNVVSRD